MNFLTSNVSSVDNRGRSQQGLVSADPSIFVLDCGCWTDRDRYFGVISGSQLLLCRYVRDPRPANAGNSKHDNDPTVVNTSTLIKACGFLNAALSNFCNDAAHFSLSEGDQTRNFYLELLQFRNVDAHTEAENTPLYLHTTPDKSSNREALITAAGELKLFIPDMHMGLIDKADNFCNKQPDSPFERAENIDLLAKLIETAKRHGAKIYQLGDMFDIWEGESSLETPAIYYQRLNTSPNVSPNTYSGIPKSQLVEDDTLKDWSSNEIRTARCREAFRQIVDRWKNAAPASFSTVMKSVTFLPGNHDFETRFLSHPASPAAVVDQAAHWLFPQYKTGIVTGLRWVAEHGHLHDSFNSTLKATSIPEVMQKVDGKRITYWWSRGAEERNESLYGMQVVTNHPSLPQPEVYIRRARDKRDNVESQVQVVGITAIKHPRALNNLGPSDVSPYTANGAGWGEMVGFDDMREQMLDGLLRHVGHANTNYWFSAWSWRSTNRFLVSYCRVGAGPRPPLIMPFRVLVHGHTHQPLVLELQFQYHAPTCIEHPTNLSESCLRDMKWEQYL